MDVQNIVRFYIILCIRQSHCQMRDFAVCHNDYNFKPSDGFLKDHAIPWLGFVQYRHETTGFGHESKAPRVVLVQQQYVLGTAADLTLLPKAYKLGNVIFGYYEREELECGLTLEDVRAGMRCNRAYLEIPVVEVTSHPEVIKFGTENSLALARLLRPMKSMYMVPICLPSLLQRSSLRKDKTVYLVDYSSAVPTNMDSEFMGMKSLKLYTQRDCMRHRAQTGLDNEGVSQILCTSGCGVRPGAPIITQTLDSKIELVGLAAGSGPCIETFMRRQLNSEPPLYIDVYPFVSWIMNVIAAYQIPKPYPQNFQLTDGTAYMIIKQQTLRNKHVRKQKSGWNGRTFLAGNYCYQSWRLQRRVTAFFYAETFTVVLKPPFNLRIIIRVYAGSNCEVACARVVLPNRFSNPEITGLGSGNITVTFDGSYCPNDFHFTLILTGTNVTRPTTY